ncbi:MAG: Rap1a/Tai family immunity protein [Candidatus Methylomirabilales bacterium]
MVFPELKDCGEERLMRVGTIIVSGIVILLLTSMDVSSQAEGESFGYFSGNNLHSLCSKTSRDFKIGVCTGYVSAIVDLFWSKNTIDGLRACVPQALSTSQARDIVMQWINDNPEMGDMKASALVAKIMAETFPCK